MNAVIALAHFCELHGPSINFCTQTIHTLESVDCCKENIDIPVRKNDAQLPPDSLSSTTSTATTEPPTPPGTVVSPCVSFRKQPPPLAQTPPMPACAACTAQLPTIIDKNGVATEASMLVTYDEENPTVRYVGRVKPGQPHLHRAVKFACERSLTGETCPGRDGPVLFGDDENGYVMSYIFKLRDAQARGESRCYSIMMLMTDRVFLISCWPFLVSAFRSMALNLQDKADAVFQRESAHKDRVPPYSRRKPPVGLASNLPQGKKMKPPVALRSLRDLLGVEDIYPQIHAQISYILKVSARRRMEKLCPGRSASPQYLKMRAESRTDNHDSEKEQAFFNHSANTSATAILHNYA
ncbi:hypothetical protein VTP01DRAFT_1040 [Rhizomucor pusillus]|uniref:uncharacterized protein n=1 Tax=Rhizomucor pusillus TaxID=4840 RepID=UPI00374383F0